MTRLPGSVLGALGAATLGAALTMAACVGSEPQIPGSKDAGGPADGSLQVDSGVPVESAPGNDTGAPTDSASDVDSSVPPPADSGQGPTDSGQSLTDSGPSPTDSGKTDAGMTPPTDSSPSGSFVGMYSCTLTYAIDVTAPLPQTVNQTTPTEMTVTENGTALMASLVTDGAPFCTLTLTDNGNGTASLDPADTQYCDTSATTPIGPIPVKVLFSMGGEATLALPSLKADLLPVAVTDGPGGSLGIVGTGTVSLDCSM